MAKTPKSQKPNFKVVGTPAIEVRSDAPSQMRNARGGVKVKVDRTRIVQRTEDIEKSMQKAMAEVNSIYSDKLDAPRDLVDQIKQELLRGIY